MARSKNIKFDPKLSVLRVWLLLNGIFSLGGLAYILLLGLNAPSLQFYAEETTDLALIQTANSMAVFVYGAYVFLISLLITLLVDGMIKTKEQFLKYIGVPLVGMQVIAFLSDLPLQNVNMFFNVLSTLILALGLYWYWESYKK